MATTTRPAATEEDLLRTPKDGQKYELVDGEIRVSPAGYLHGRVCARLTVPLGAFVEERRLGDLLDSSTGFRLPGGNVRLPDPLALSQFPTGKPRVEALVVVLAVEERDDPLGLGLQ